MIKLENKILILQKTLYSVRMGCASSSPPPLLQAASILANGNKPSAPFIAITDELFPSTGDYFHTTPDSTRSIPNIALDVFDKYTLVELLESCKLNHETEHAMCVLNADNLWEPWSWKQYYNESVNFAKAMLTFESTKPFQGMCIFGYNSPYWFVAHMGAMLIQVLPAGIYPTDTRELLAYKVTAIDATTIVVDDKRLDLVMEALESMPTLQRVIVYPLEFTTARGVPASYPPKLVRKVNNPGDVEVFAFSAFLQLGRVAAETQPLLEERGKSIKPENCALLSFTGGTTGMPKVAMLSHDSLCYQAQAVRANIPAFFGDTRGERLLSYLPLPNVAALVFDLVAPIVSTGLNDGSKMGGFVTTFFSKSDDLKNGQLGERLLQVRPTIFLGIPLVYEKIQEKLVEVGAKLPKYKRKLAAIAKAATLREAKSRQSNPPADNKKESGWFLLDELLIEFAQSKVLPRVREALGLDCAKTFLSVATPLKTPTLEYFSSLGIPIHQVYVSSESCGVLCMTTAEASTWGSVGRPLLGAQVDVNTLDGKSARRCSNLLHPHEEEVGQICFRGRGVMLGYLSRRVDPSLAAGWCATGDVGCVSAEGVVRVLGRWTDMIQLSGGARVLPGPIEDAIALLAPGVSRVVLVGREFTVGLVTLRQHRTVHGEEAGDGRLEGSACVVNPKVKTVEQAMGDATWEAFLRNAIHHANEGGFFKEGAHRIRRFTILPRDFSIRGEELTSTMELKRSVIEAKHKAILDKMFLSRENDPSLSYVKF